MTGDMPSVADHKALYWRASRRGMLEVSIILRSYLDLRNGWIKDRDYGAMVDLLDLPDADLWDILVTESKEVEASQTSLVRDLRNHARNIHANPRCQS